MPIPKPKKDETEDEFIERCMSDDIMVDEYEQKQRSAICYSQWRERENMRHIQIRTNAGKVRRETVNGRKYLVAPVVAVKEGILNYEDGTEFIPADEIKNSVDLWNGVDLPIGHPEMHGQSVSAKNKVVVDKNAVGRMWNAHYEDKKLKGELWIDIKKCENMGETAREVISKLENEKPIDVSTAYRRTADISTGEYDGGNYDTIQRDLRPDHLALLPHGTGNMSWSDGVGTPRLNEGDYMKLNVRSTARTPSYSGTSTGKWNAPSLGDLGFDSVADMSSSDKTDIAEHSLLGEVGADTFNELLVLPVVNASGNLNKNALANAKARANQVSGISGDTVNSVKNKCTQLLKDEFDVEYEENIADKVFNKLKNYFGSENTMTEDMEVVAENTGFDAEELEDLTDEQVSKWASAYNEGPEEPEEETAENDGPSDGTKLEDKVENQAKEIEELKTKLEEQEAEDREEYVETITANSDWKKDELKDFDNEKLEMIANKNKSADFRGQAGSMSDKQNKKVASDKMENFQLNRRGDE